MGSATPEEIAEVEQMAAAYPEVREELASISKTLEIYASQSAIEPDVTVRPFLMATIDYTERLKNGEVPQLVPMLNANSKVSDYSTWIDRADMVVSESFSEYEAKIIGYTPQAITAIVWIKNGVPEEKHDHELENFLILEGSCDIKIGNNIISLKAGDYYQIPLTLSHSIKITSAIPCKAILQRVAA
jgi:mannose-6-phosphate isomerase-like protein (cupin superfamily)